MNTNDNYPNRARRERNERLEERQLEADMKAQAAEDKAYSSYADFCRNMNVPSPLEDDKAYADFLERKAQEFEDLRQLELDQLIAEHNQKRNAMLAEPKNPQ